MVAKAFGENTTYNNYAFEIVSVRVAGENQFAFLVFSNRTSVNHGQPSPIDVELEGSPKFGYENSRIFRARSNFGMLVARGYG